MKKLIIKISILVTTLFLFNLNTSFAQEQATNDLVGIWELKGPKQLMPNGKEVSLFHFIKIFNKDGSFSNLNFFPETSVISHAGTYKIEGDGYYEAIIDENLIDNLDTAQKLTFKFSDDKKTLFLSGTLKGKNGNTVVMKEEWQKIGTKNK